MAVTERDRRRLDALIAIVKPANSLAARLETLTDEQRDYHERWQAHHERWMRDHDDGAGRAYELTLHGYGPQLRSDIRAALFGREVTLPITATDDDAARIYNDYLGQQR